MCPHRGNDGSTMPLCKHNELNLADGHGEGGGPERGEARPRPRRLRRAPEGKDRHDTYIHALTPDWSRIEEVANESDTASSPASRLGTAAGLACSQGNVMKQLYQKEFQIEHLRQEVANLCHQPVSTDIVRSTEQQGPRSDTFDLDAIDPEILRDYAEKKLRDKSRNETVVGHRCDKFLNDYIRTMSLPEVRPFGGQPSEGFKRFLKSFEIKYPSRQWKDSRRLPLFESFLCKDALTLFETLPRAVKKSTFECVVAEMKKRMSIDSNGEKVTALTELRRLTIGDNQSVSEFCLVLERLASKAYPDIPVEVTTLQEAEILCRQLEWWNGSYCLTEALETSNSREVYEKVKETALRLEGSLKVANECSTGRRQRTEKRSQFKPQWIIKRRSSSQNSFGSEKGLVINKKALTNKSTDSRQDDENQRQLQSKSRGDTPR
ncbi:unnamed protein product [Heligmosomoides polygyrus]|uniref:Retrotransposon gag domain-containing protein n=1 Tax=Heligmosomoides polygyrus TaxID=6339 RepID=A0A183GKP5_HELPZ|nr:unnamed protein product [Heligmosomoides polygyrus]